MNTCQYVVALMTVIRFVPGRRQNRPNTTSHFCSAVFRVYGYSDLDVYIFLPQQCPYKLVYYFLQFVFFQATVFTKMIITRRNQLVTPVHLSYLSSIVLMIIIPIFFSQCYQIEMLTVKKLSSFHSNILKTTIDLTINVSHDLCFISHLNNDVLNVYIYK